MARIQFSANIERMELREIAGIFDNARTRPSYAIKRLFHRYCLRHRSNFSTFLRFSLLPFLPPLLLLLLLLLSKKFRLHLLASLGNLENWKWKKCVNLFRINRISILFRDIRATRNARLPLRNIWRDNSSKENHGLVPSALKIPLIRVISGKGRASDSAFGPVFTPSIRVGDLRVHDRQSRLSTCDDVSPLLLSRRLFPRSLNDSSRVIVQTMPHTGKFVGSIEKIERSICN